MKQVLAFAAVATIASLAATSASSEACGYYMPQLRVFRIASHYTKAGGRSFVMMNKHDDAGHAFTPIEEMSYDASSVSPLKTEDRALEITLVGEKGVAKTQSRSRVLLKDWMAGRGDTVEAFELPLGKQRDYTLAVFGKHANLAWKPFAASAAATESDRTWLETNNQIANGTDLDNISKFAMTGGYIGYASFDATTMAYHTVVRHPSGQFWGVFNGTPFGTLSVDGETRIVFDDRGAESTLEVL